MKPVYPKLRDTADEAATSAQRVYLALNLLQLSFLCLAALASGVNLSYAAYRSCAAWCVCVFMFLAVSSSLAIKVGRFEVRWFKCRAFAENAKSIVWRFVMSTSADQGAREKEYLNEWLSLQKRLPELQREFALCEGSGKLITSWMQGVSGRNLEGKVSIYRSERVDDQREWYALNARINAGLHSRFFWLVFALELGTIAYAAIQASRLLPINFVGFIVGMGSGLLVWSQTKRYSDLATTYAVAAEDLNQISAKYTNAEDAEALASFVSDVEEAVSREHGMWLARRVGPC